MKTILEDKLGDSIQLVNTPGLVEHLFPTERLTLAVEEALCAHLDAKKLVDHDGVLAWTTDLKLLGDHDSQAVSETMLKDFVTEISAVLTHACPNCPGTRRRYQWSTGAPSRSLKRAEPTNHKPEIIILLSANDQDITNENVPSLAFKFQSKSDPDHPPQAPIEQFLGLNTWLTALSTQTHYRYQHTMLSLTLAFCAGSNSHSDPFRFYHVDRSGLLRLRSTARDIANDSAILVRLLTGLNRCPATATEEELTIFAKDGRQCIEVAGFTYHLLEYVCRSEAIRASVRRILSILSISESRRQNADDPRHQLCHRQRQRRVVTAPLGDELSMFSSKRELLSVLIDAIRAHQEMLETKNTLHRDISYGNVMMHRRPAVGNSNFTSTSAGPRPQFREGLLLGPDHSIDVKGLPHKTTAVGHRTGTPPFMAINVLLGRDHEPKHDLESFFYVLTWICTFFNGPNNSPRKQYATTGIEWTTIGVQVSGSSDTRYDLDLDYKALAARKIMAFRSDDQNFEEQVSAFVAPYFDDLLPCLSDLRELFYEGGPPTHSRMIDILSRHMNTLPDELDGPSLTKLCCTSP